MSAFSEAGQKTLSKLLAYTPEFDARIKCSTEISRKRALKLLITAPDGKPVERATIRFKLRKHEFRFGANAFMLNQFRG